ncbi:hypothetical protein CDG77_34065 [Nostoc sp. 'Peltigera membranacea cyanobiont' 213]|nr:hypothetical protein CDG77_34065 [Nostoc sp. 'Peltigera membranacea cyanobiont' 213]
MIKKAIAFKHLPEKDIYVQLINSYNLGLVFPIDLVYLVNSVQIIYTYLLAALLRQILSQCLQGNSQ